MDEPTNLGLDPERLSMLDLQGHKKIIIPAEVYGYWRQKRNLVYSVLIVLFLILPWTKINGLQTILLNIPERKFIFFGIQFWAHDAPMIFFLLAISTLGLAFVTSIWGRIWCGWACPQTVFIDHIYRRIEIFIEGPYLKRRELAQKNWDLNKFFKKSFKWFCFFIVSSLIAHSFAAYFVGAPSLTQWIFSLSVSEHETTFYIVSFITLVLLFDFGWFREQFCIIMCPYGRFQSVLMDQKSLSVMYDQKRGEPRRGVASTNEKTGDCIACNRCVQVCPTGIDIRKGVQMECITCTACIDACDEIMDKVKKPKGLIRYETVSGKKNKVTNPRSLVYLTFIVLCLAGLTYLLSQRKSVDIVIIRGKDTPYQVVTSSDGKDTIINHFKLHVKNQKSLPLELRLNVPDEFKDLNVEIKTAENPVRVQPLQDQTIHAFVVFPKSILQSLDQRKIFLAITVNEIGAAEKTEPQNKPLDFILVGPK